MGKGGPRLSGYFSILDRWQSRQLRCPKDLDCLLEDFNPRFARESCLLEGWDLPLEAAREVFRGGEASRLSGDPQALSQLRCQKACYSFLRERVLARDDLDASLVLGIHRVLDSGAARQQDSVTQHSRAGAPAQEAARDLNQLLETVGGYCGPEPLQAAAYLHARFENIRPFPTGNGSTGRVLANFFLMARDHPPLIIFARDRDRYFQCLAAFDQSGDCRPLGAFFQEQLEKTWKL